MGKTSKLWTKNRQDAVAQKFPKFKFIVGKGKDKIQWESSVEDTQIEEESEEGLLEEELQQEQQLEKGKEEEYDEEGLPKIPSIS